MAYMFNPGPIGYDWTGAKTAGTEPEPARYLGGVVLGTSGGRLDLQSEFFYGLSTHKPKRVLISNADPDFPYLSDEQSTDRVIEFSLLDPWAPSTVPVLLRLIDPPDLAPYDAKDLDNPSSFAAFPYEADDNHVGIDNCVAAGECGLSLNADGSSPVRELTVTPPGPIYLKIPDDVSGESFQVEMSKVDPATSLPIPERVLTLGPVFTSWKRIFVERDRMFRRGGLLVRDFDPETCGAGGVEPECDQVIVFDWSNIAVDDEIVLFQSDRPAGGQNTVSATVTAVSTAGQPYTNSRRVSLDLDLGSAGHIWHASSDQPPNVGDTASVDFEGGKSAGLGVLSGCDSDSNQINAADSCFFEGDMRLVEPVFGDAMVEIKGGLSKQAAVPYYPGEEDETPGRWLFSWLWFGGADWPNAVHLLGGVEVSERDTLVGVAKRFHGVGPEQIAVRTSYSLAGRIEELLTSGAPCFVVQPKDEVIQDVTAHELVHQVPTNMLLATGEHCFPDTWLSPGEGCLLHKTAHCPGIEPVRLDANVDSLTTDNGGDLYDLRFNEDPLPALADE